MIEGYRTGERVWILHEPYGPGRKTARIPGKIVGSTAPGPARNILVLADRDQGRPDRDAEWFAPEDLERMSAVDQLAQRAED